MNAARINECAFDSHCKKVLRNEARNCFAEIKRQREKEIMLSELPESAIDQFQFSDTYDVEQCSFSVIGQIIVIQDEQIGKAIESLSELRREIILLTFCIGFNDREIGEQIGLPRSTVQYQRKAALAELREKLQESRYDSPI